MKIGIPIGISNKQYFINQVYVDFVKNAGYEPIIIAPTNNIQVMVELCDGVLLPGGKDIEPTYYGSDNTYSNKVDPKKDAFERSVLHECIKNNKPVFGICRGFQLICREFMKKYDKQMFGMHYRQHISSHSVAKDREIDRNIPAHRVHIVDGTRLYEERKESIFVNSIHHQAVMANMKMASAIRVSDGSNIKVIATTTRGLLTSDISKVVEAVDVTWEGCKIRGVQFHPEEMNDIALLKYFFDNV